MKYESITKIMTKAHTMTKALISQGDARKYRLILSVSLEALKISRQECTNQHINWLKSMYLNKLVDLSLIESMHQANTYSLNFESNGQIKVTHDSPYYVEGIAVERARFYIN